MPALTMKAKKVEMSLNYDGFTVYQNTTLDPILLLFFADQCQIQLMQNLSKCYTEYKDKMHPQRFIYHDDPDHNLYHQDMIDMYRSHTHMKFTSMIDKPLLQKILNIAVSYNILDTNEACEFLARYQQRFNQYQFELHEALLANGINVNTIFHFIKNISDNEILADLHQYLLSDEFKEFRSTKDPQLGGATQWRGENENHDIAPCSKGWALVEKAISARMAQNILDHTSLTPQVATERADQLKHDMKFFAIKRKENRPEANNRLYNDFHSRDLTQMHCAKVFGK